MYSSPWLVSLTANPGFSLSDELTRKEKAKRTRLEVILVEVECGQNTQLARFIAVISRAAQHLRSWGNPLCWTFDPY